MVEAIEDPGKERVHLEEDPFLPQLVELRVSVEESGGNELVEDTHDKRRKDCEEDVIEGEGPRLKNDLP